MIGRLITRLTANLRYPTLFLIVGALFLINVVVPDFIPFYDEILLAMLTVLIGSIRKKRPPIDGAATAPDETDGSER
jgi:hypothetical protein